MSSTANISVNNSGCSMGRLRAVAFGCRTRHGNCDCKAGFCKVVNLGSEKLFALINAKQLIENEIRTVESIIQKAQTPPATLRTDFEFANELTPVMVFSGDEAEFGYEDKNGNWFESSEWPFNESFIYPDDCERNGIRVE